MSVLTDVPDEIFTTIGSTVLTECVHTKSAICEDEVFWLIKQPGLSDLIY